MEVIRLEKKKGYKIISIKLIPSNETDEVIRKILDNEENKQAFIKKAILEVIK